MTLSELIQRYADCLVHQEGRAAIKMMDEIEDRLARIEKFKGTEASAIKDILNRD